MDDLQQRAEQQLAEREARLGPVANRERYLAAILRSLEREQRQLPTASTAAAQEEIRARHEATRQPLPPKPTTEDKELAEYWLARIKAQLGRPVTRE